MKKLLSLFIALSISVSAASAQYTPPGGGGGGSGTVTSVATSNGVAGGTITASGTITLAKIADDTVLGSVTAGNQYPVALSATQLTTIPNVATDLLQGMVPALTDAQIYVGKTSSPIQAVTLSGPIAISDTGLTSFAAIAAYSGYANNTSSSAAPTVTYLPIGYQTYAINTTLTASSPTYNTVTAGSVTTTLPVASTCIGKMVSVYNAYNNFGNTTISRQSSDVVQFGVLGNSVTTFTMLAGSYCDLMATASGVWTVLRPPTLFLALNPSTNGGGVLYSVGTSGAMGCGTWAQNAVLIGANSGGNPPLFTNTPGSPGTLTSITTAHVIANGTAPTVAAGAGAGTSPTVTIAGHDTDFSVTLITGTMTTTGVLFTVTFGTAYGTAPYPQMTPATANADALVPTTSQPYPTTTTTTLLLNTGAAALTASTTYVWNFHNGQ